LYLQGSMFGPILRRLKLAILLVINLNFKPYGL
jgi:hypothetical protein